MNSSIAQTIITNATTEYGVALLFILSSIIGIGLGVLVFNYGWRKLKIIANTAPKGVNAYFTNKRYGISSDGKRYDTWSS